MPDQDKKFEIPVSGNLGLLALGYRGVEAWRKVRDEAETEEQKKGKKHRK
ncbi:MAG: hypothetical protein RLP14_00910 [Owenweeksia sp.]